MKKVKVFSLNLSKHVVVLAGILFVSMLTFFLPESFARDWTDNDGVVYTTIPRDCLALDAQGNNKGLYAVYSDGTIMPAEGPIDHGPQAAGGSAPCYYQDQLGLWAGKWDIWGIFDETLTGYVYAPVTGTYKFLLSADDQAWLIFNGASLITTPYCASAIATIDLAGGTWYPIQIKYQNRSGSNWFGFLWHLPSKIVVKDGVDFSTGSTISNDPQRLALGGREVSTAVADGVTRLLLRLDGSGAAEFSVNDLSNGSLSSLSNQSNTSTNPPSIPSVNTIQGEKIFAVYKVPDNFVSDSNNAYLSEREITVHVKFHPGSGGETTAEQKIKLRRPPVMLIHGIWSDYFKSFLNSGIVEYLQNSISGIRLVPVNYPNASSIYSNYVIVGNKIKSEIYSLRNQGIAVSQVDIIAHSMGGVLSRLFAEAGAPYYINRENYNEGYINKLITVDTPHKGAYLADMVLGTYYDWITSLDPRLQLRATILKTIVEAKLGQILAGAVSDLRVENLNNNNSLLALPNIKGHTIVGNVLGNNPFVNLPVYGSLYYLLFQLDVNFPIGLAPSDGVVEEMSQRGGLSGAATDEFAHIHLGKSLVPLLVLGCMENNQVQELVNFLLNDDPNSNNFSGF